jgi:hypothetical protein
LVANGRPRLKMDAASIAGEPDAPLFQTAALAGLLTGKAMRQQDAYRMIQRRTGSTGIKTRIGNHTFRATGTAYPKIKGTLEIAQHIASHESRGRPSSTTGDKLRFHSKRLRGLLFWSGTVGSENASISNSRIGRVNAEPRSRRPHRPMECRTRRSNHGGTARVAWAPRAAP